ncbi:hypothetical protein K1719_037716 [Acacia pycnantha]|nr:hypothetical protein K1719_037716 [Acacia pycnantha]
MKFKKGTKVEVLSKSEVPSGSWRCADIICGNGHYYSVRYDGLEGAPSKEIVERVPRNAIRSCPHVLEVTENWRPVHRFDIRNEGRYQRARVAYPFMLPKQVDDVAISRGIQKDIVALQKKGTSDAEEQVGKAHARADELEKQAGKLKRELELQNKEKVALEARVNEAEKRILT